jgi:hypothetical protein
MFNWLQDRQLLITIASLTVIALCLSQLETLLKKLEARVVRLEKRLNKTE